MGSLSIAKSVSLYWIQSSTITVGTSVISNQIYLHPLFTQPHGIYAWLSTVYANSLVSPLGSCHDERFTQGRRRFLKENLLLALQKTYIKDMSTKKPKKPPREETTPVEQKETLKRCTTSQRSKSTRQNPRTDLPRSAKPLRCGGRAFDKQPRGYPDGCRRRPRPRCTSATAGEQRQTQAGASSNAT